MNSDTTQRQPQTDNTALSVAIMAAGKGTRMKSQLPKVLQLLAGQPLLQHVLATAGALLPAQIIVITGHASAAVESALAPAITQLAPAQVHFVLQQPQLGTGHALQQAAPLWPDEAVVLVLSGDVPLIQADTLAQLIELCGGKQLALLTAELADPSGYGRIVRKNGALQAIVEQKDASPEQLAIHEVYSGIMAAPAGQLKTWLAQLDNHNAQGEYYLTDIVQYAVAAGLTPATHKINDPTQIAGVNDPIQLAQLERCLQQRLAQQLMQQGVRLADPGRLDVRGQLICGQDVSIDINCIFEGRVKLGDRVRIGANCIIKNASIAADAVIHPFSHIEGSAASGLGAVTIDEQAQIGPFARLRPGAKLGAAVHIGNFVEVKNSTLGAGAKANHLAYLGDATVGARVNYGAGSITANYDGANKHRTVIEADVHIGSNCVLVAPLTVGTGATVGAGSTLTKATPPQALGIARARQVNIPNWQRPAKK